MHQIKTILEYEGYDVSSAHIRDRLRLLSALSVIVSYHGTRVDMYQVTCSMSPDTLDLLYSQNNIDHQGNRT